MEQNAATIKTPAAGAESHGIDAIEHYCFFLKINFHRTRGVGITADRNTVFLRIKMFCAEKETQRILFRCTDPVIKMP